MPVMDTTAKGETKPESCQSVPQCSPLEIGRILLSIESILVNTTRVGQRPDATPPETLVRATLPFAQAPRAPHLDRQTPLPRSDPLRLPSIASHPRVGSGNVLRPPLRSRPGDPSTDPDAGTLSRETHRDRNCPPAGFATAALAAPR